MPSNSAGPASAAAEQIKETMTEGARKAAGAVNESRQTIAQGLDTAAETVERKSDQLPHSFDAYADEASDGLKTAARYVRRHDANDMAEDLVDVLKANPLASLLVIGGVVVGGSLLIKLLAAGEENASHSDNPQSLLSPALESLGPRASEAITRVRDAAFNLAMAKAVDTLEEIFPGFREHFEKA
jgi:hypothetical protein